MSKTLIFTFEDTNPKILIEEKNGEQRTVVATHENLYDIINLIDARLKLELNDTNKVDFVKGAYARAVEGIIDNPETYLDLDLGDKQNFGLVNYIGNELNQKIIEKDDFGAFGELDEKVVKELEYNQNNDILAVLIDKINNVLISKTIEMYNYHHANKVILSDTIGLVRLQELFSKELATLEIDFEIENAM